MSEALRTALSAIPWIDPEDAYTALSGQLLQNEKGEWFVASSAAPTASPETPHPGPLPQGERENNSTPTTTGGPDSSAIGVAPATPNSEPAAPDAPAAPIPLAEAIQALAKRKPHWVKAQLTPGTGAAGSPAFGTSTNAGTRYANSSSVGASTPLAYSDLLKPENGPLLRELIHSRPQELARLRESHFAR